MRHKLTTFIIKNPPKKRSKASRKTSDGPSKDKTEDDNPEGNSPIEDEDNDPLTQRLQSEAAELAPVEEAAIAQEDWSADADIAPVAKRVQSLTLDDSGDEDRGDDPMDQLRLWIEVDREKVTSEGLIAKIEELGIKEKHKTVQVVVESLFTSKILTGKELDAFNPALKQVRILAVTVFCWLNIFCSWLVP